MSIDHPKALIQAFKDSGEFDRLEKELLAEFQKDESYSRFKTDIGDIVRQRLTKAQMLQFLPQDMVTRELMQEVERHPILERAVKDMRMFSDPAFLSRIKNLLQGILREDKKKSSAGQSVTELDQDGPPQLQGISSRKKSDSANFQSKTHEVGVTADDAMDVDND